VKRLSPGLIKFAVIALVVAPVFVSLAWREAARPCDYAAQGGLLLLMLTMPFCTRLQSGFGKPFAQIYAVGLTWGLWRVFYFDPVTQNDIPGVGYLIAPVMMGGISAAIFGIRSAASRGRT
jgi:hypothetical protein